MSSIIAGQTYTFTADYFNEPGSAGVLADPTGSIQLTITYGTTGSVVAGPFPYAGGSTPSPSAVYRTGVGVYAYQWQSPQSSPTGVYVANWQFTDGPEATQYFGEENLTVIAAGTSIPSPSETGFWTGSLTYAAQGVSIPFGSVDGNGIAWLLQGIDGLDGAPTVGQVLQRAGDHGGYPTPQFYGPRPMTIRLRAAGVSQALRDTARAIVQQAVPVSDLATLIYNEPVPKALLVRRSGRLIEKYPTLNDVDFQIGVIAPDPRKYGVQVFTLTASANGQLLGLAPPLTPPVLLPAQPPPGSVTIVNHGNFETRPLIVIAGPITAPALYNQTTNQAVSFSTLTLGATDRLTVDLLGRTASLNGASRPADPWSSWWVVPPGTSQIVLQGNAAAGSQMTVTYQDAWM